MSQIEKKQEKAYLKSLEDGENEGFLEPIHSRITYFMGILGFITLFYIGFVHIDLAWGQFGIFQATLGVIGVFGTISLYSKVRNPTFSSKHYKTLLIDLTIALIFIAIAQLLGQIEYAIGKTYRGLYYLAVAITEEIFFRGYLLNAIRKTRGTQNRDGKKFEFDWLAIIFQGVAFASIHVNYYPYPIILIAVGFGGILLGVAYSYTNNLTALVIAHFLLNFSVAYEYLVRFSAEGTNHNTYIAIYIFSLIFGLYVLYVSMENLRKHEEKREEENFDTQKHKKLKRITLLVLILNLINIIIILSSINILTPAEVIP